MAALLLGKFYKLHSTPGNFNNQFGLPLTLFQLSKNHNLMVAELGASRPGDIAALAECLKPRWGVITNVHPAHLEGLGSLEAVYRVKLELADALEKEKGTLVIPGHDKKLVREAEKRSLKLVTFGIGEGFHYSVTETKVREEEIDFEINRRVRFRIQSQGLFNVSNAAAAIALASELGVPLEAMPKSLRKFRPLSGRFETLSLSPGVVVIHDAYNANPASMRASLESFRRIPNLKRRILVLGDMLELGCEAENFHREIGREVASMKPDCLITLGKNAQKIAEEAKASGERARTVSEVYHCANHGEVTALLLEKLSPGDGVFFKASHSMDFEKVVEFLKSHLGVMRCSTASSQ
jgi:UDP-N-acetylmuramoyl-tripeptide--D-alanyl-D-alanine ligase